MKNPRTLSTAACAILALFALTPAQAIPISGTLWTVTEAQAQAANPALVPPASNVTFTVNPSGVLGLELNFGVDGPPSAGAPTVQQFLNSSTPAVTGVTANGGFDLNKIMDTCEGWPTGPAVNDNCNAPGQTGSYVQFTGTAFFTSGQTWDVAHDDGLVMSINGIGVTGFTNSPFNVPSETGTYSGPTGNFPFKITYAECCDGSARLHFISTFVPKQDAPEPATLALMGLGLAGLGFARRRKVS